MSNFAFAQFDDWVVVYKDGVEVFQHHSPDWVDVFDWLGVPLDYLGYYNADDFDGHFPGTLEGFASHVAAINNQSGIIAEKKAQIVTLATEIAELEGK